MIVQIGDVPDYNEVMKLIGSVNVDAEIGKMLDAFYVNDNAELKFFSDITQPVKLSNMSVSSPMDRFK